MRTPGSPRGVRHAVALLAAAAMLALTGCAGSGDEAPTDTAAQETTAAPTPAPTELTEAEALDIAVTTYEQFLYAERDALASGGDSIGDLESLTTDKMQEYLDGILELAASDDFTVEGDLSVIEAEVQKFSDDAVTFYACVDLADSQMYDGDGVPYGDDRSGVIQPTEIRVVNLSTAPQVDGQKFWPELDLCQ